MFRASEVIEIAVTMEKNGQALYQAMSAATTSPELKAIQANMKITLRP